MTRVLPARDCDLCHGTGRDLESNELRGAVCPACLGTGSGRLSRLIAARAERPVAPETNDEGGDDVLHDA